MQIVVRGLLTTYVRSGQGKTVILLHGWGDRARGFAAIQSALAASYDVIAPDLPGFGGTQPPPSAWGLDDYARFVAELAEKLELRLYAVVGHSNGGAIAVRGFGRGALTAERLVLLASSGIRGEYKGRVRVLRYAAKTGKAIMAPLPIGMKQKLRRSVYSAIGSDMLVAEHLQETFKRVATDDVRNDARHIATPTLLIYGANDTETPVRYGALLHRLIRQSLLKVIPNAGHFVHADQSAEVIKAIEEFLR